MGVLNLCWQECPWCSRIGIGSIGAPYCKACYARFEPLYKNVERLIHAHLEDWDMSAEEVNSAAKGLINKEFFTTGHKSSKLRGAYNAARSARFEYGQSPE